MYLWPLLDLYLFSCGRECTQEAVGIFGCHLPFTSSLEYDPAICFEGKKTYRMLQFYSWSITGASDDWKWICFVSVLFLSARGITFSL